MLALSRLRHQRQRSVPLWSSTRHHQIFLVHRRHNPDTHEITADMHSLSHTHVYPHWVAGTLPLGRLQHQWQKNAAHQSSTQHHQLSLVHARCKHEITAAISHNHKPPQIRPSGCPGAEGPGFKSQPRHCRVTVLGKLFTTIVALFTKQ